jgi:hypothetical protein
MRAGRFLTIPVLLLAATAMAQQMSQEEMMQKYMEAATPGEPHQLLAKGAGTWKTTTKSWMDPAGEPMVTHGTETATMILGGRFLESRAEGAFMGTPMQGFGLIGYDNVKQRYCGVWCDTMGTGLMSYEGDYDAQAKELVCTGDFIDAATGQKVTARLVTRWRDDGTHLFRLYSPGPDGQEFMWMEMVYERAE